MSFTFAVAGISRALSHQLVRHRIASYSQQSQRYVDAAGFDYVLPPQVAAVPEARERFEAAMLKLLGQPGLSVWHRDCIMRELGRKTAVYRRGCLKNGLPEEAERIRVLVDAAQKTTPTTGCAAPGRAQAGPRAPGSRD